MFGGCLCEGAGVFAEEVCVGSLPASISSAPTASLTCRFLLLLSFYIRRRRSSRTSRGAEWRTHPSSVSRYFELYGSIL